MLKILHSTLFAVTALSLPTHAAIIADLDADVGAWVDAGGNGAGNPNPSQFPAGWTFSWNPTNQSLVGGTWEPIPNSGNTGFKVASTVANAAVTYSSEQTVSVNTSTNGAGNVYGGTNSFLSTDGISHYTILTYTVQAGEAGIATIDTEGSGGNSTNGDHVILHNGNILSSIIGGNGRTTLENVTLNVGDTVSFAYVNLAQDADDQADNYVEDLTQVNKNTTRWYAQATIDVVPEPSTSILAGLSMCGLLIRRRR
ncbi:PEP-CTERM sorting domain-containing protein [Luteolibacter algae]|uniref:PEP-CTERM sorting domain-containing protein n=1 Tax=Luteolibacter algae TaxID=454151 RepID=A0ABW5DE58_9BACT